MKQRIDEEQRGAAKALQRLGIGYGLAFPGREDAFLLETYRLSDWSDVLTALSWSIVETPNSPDSESAQNALWPRSSEQGDWLERTSMPAPLNLTERRDTYAKLHGISLSTLLRMEQRGFLLFDAGIRRNLNSLTWPQRRAAGPLSQFDMVLMASVVSLTETLNHPAVIGRENEFLDRYLTDIKSHQNANHENRRASESARTAAAAKRERKRKAREAGSTAG
ncbi:hypothetical protein C1I64_04890 [Rathayibacter festucae DSM 15932]|uniref:Uncharacterized protein n=1 Tax=Rathayibacter festucae DSM 15932 TaxID=1328866 RepID=A0A3Q9UVG8_9MICO|nr:hypothetical protein C1I64_04890 [Rathayibacter festucae DSM 15932]